MNTIEVCIYRMLYPFTFENRMDIMFFYDFLRMLLYGYLQGVPIIKKTLLALLVTTSSLSAVDLDIDMGTGLFYTGAKGRIEYTDEGFTGSYSEIDMQTSGQFYIWADLKSNIEYLPKLRLQYLKINAQGDSKLHLEADTSDLPPEYQIAIDIFNNRAWPSGLSHNIYDIYLYYEFFEEKAYPSIGVGGGLKSFDYAYNAELILPLHIGDRGGKSIPMLFITSRYEIPTLQLGFEVENEVYVFGDSNLYDARAKMDLLFELDDNSKLGLEVGYRKSYYDLRGRDVETFKANMSYSGIYVGVTGSFK